MQQFHKLLFKEHARKPIELADIYQILIVVVYYYSFFIFINYVHYLNPFIHRFFLYYLFIIEVFFHI